MQEIYKLFEEEIQGGVYKGFMTIIDEFIDRKYFTEEFFNKNELEIAKIFDDVAFECEGCGWTVPRDNEGIYDGYCMDHDDEDIEND